jgi:DMSO/TMAO reductase YedYZ molybdopterin-dependent catalytic subunit
VRAAGNLTDDPELHFTGLADVLAAACVTDHAAHVAFDAADRSEEANPPRTV